MDPFQTDAQAGAREPFGPADLDDRWRLRQLTRVAAQLAADPSASNPGQMEGWAEAKSAYRLPAPMGSPSD
ncbi:transposase DNA-binding-containing protein [Paludisphaera soli]|uniref:transposase DNA-binding-containing protein n=1 Tax=Paludisphaera soli TaxID=2712865 RepID=UPI0013ECFBBF|nr:transposase DNA-binding-containing protein [Paludisphaera soli]